jgi:hypothetical protein
MKSRMAWRSAPRSSSRGGRCGPLVREAGRAISDSSARRRGDPDGAALTRGLPPLEIQ